MELVDFRLVEEGNVVAQAFVRIPVWKVVIGPFRIITGKHGNFVSCPRLKVGDEWRDCVVFENAGAKERFSAKVNELLALEVEKAKKVAPAPAMQEEEEEEELPF